MNIILHILKAISGFCLLVFFFFGISGFLKYSNEHTENSKFFAYFAKHGTFAIFIFCLIAFVGMIFIYTVMPEPLDNEEREAIKEQFYDDGYHDGYNDGYTDGYDFGYEEGYDEDAPETHLEQAYEDGYNDGYTDGQYVASQQG